MEIKTIASSGGNYTPNRTQKIQYIVMHYTANNGDTAENNGIYFSRTNVSASAHYFVDENEVVQSVADGDTAWHCGASFYYHDTCRNSNSIGVEMCSRIDSNGKYYIQPRTVEKATALVKSLMEQYDIPVDHVLRHNDVTGKLCPMPWVEDESQWTDFLAGLQTQPMAVTEARAVVQAKAGLTNETMAFLDCYRYGDDLVLKLAKAMEG